MPSLIQQVQIEKKLENATKLELAKRELNSIQEKFKRFKQRSRENTQRKAGDKTDRSNNIPSYNTARTKQVQLVPDLSKYFSFMMEKENNPSLQNQVSTKKEALQQKIRIQGQLIQKNQNQKFHDRPKRSIEEKLLEQKNFAINNLQQFFTSKKLQLDERANQLSQMKMKIVQDINLLKRDNTELQTQIQIQKSMMCQNATNSLKVKNNEILQKIQGKKRTIQNLKNSIQKISSKKDQLKKNINECLKGNKNFIIQQSLTN